MAFLSITRLRYGVGCFVDAFDGLITRWLTVFGNVIVCLWKRSRDVLHNNLLNIFEINKDMLFRGSITVKRVLTETKVLFHYILIGLLSCFSAVLWIVVQALISLTRHVVRGLILVASAEPFYCVVQVEVCCAKTFSQVVECIICSDGIFIWLILLSVVKMCLRVMRLVMYWIEEVNVCASRHMKVEFECGSFCTC
jgi:hypothetical protein